MTVSYLQAIDDMVLMFKQTWDAGTTAIVGLVPEVRYQGAKKESALPVNVYWARWSQQTVIQRQDGFSNGAPNTRRFLSLGLLTVQLFAPQDANQSMDKLRKLAMLARDAYKAKRSPNGITFTNVRVNELDPDGKEFRANVVSDYQFHSVG